MGLYPYLVIIRRNGLLLQPTTWINLQRIMFVGEKAHLK